MTQVITLYTGPLSMFGMKVEIALLEKQLPFERVDVPYGEAGGYSPKHPEVLRINPKAQVPVLVDGDLELFDSTQIFEYIEDISPQTPLWPEGPRERARTRLLEQWSDEIFFPHVVRLMGLQHDLQGPVALAAITEIQAHCRQLEQRLDDHPYLSGTLSYADIAFYLAQLFAERMGAPLPETTPQLAAWRARMGDRAAVRPVMSRLIRYLRDNKRFIPAYLAVEPT